LDISGFAVEFASSCDGDADVDGLIQQFRVTIAGVGFEASAGGAWVKSADMSANRFYFNDWPAAWAATYAELTKVENDPVVTEVERRMRPFLVSEIRRDPLALRFSPRIFAAYDAFGWRDVFAVPIHGPSGYCGLVALATRRQLDLGGPQRSALELMSTALHRRCREALDIGQAQPPIAALTPRQRECLRWASAGKTDDEIGAIVGIRAATAHFHIEEAKRRLQAGTRAAAIAKAILSGQL
jgi:LuxR family quorum sensing-dependent transcriptional regulator